MRAIYIEKPGSVENLKVREVPDPKPQPGEVLIRVKAAGINFADVLARQGIYPAVKQYPVVVGYEVAGLVKAVGDGVDEKWVGKSVLAMPYFGGYAELAVCDVRYIWEKPASLSFEQAAALPENYITAWALMVGLGGLKPRETALIHNAGGGVGLAALDIAKHIGATVIGTASPRKHAFLKARGCVHCVDYTQPNWPAEVLRLTDNKGVELAIDPIGGPNWKKSYSVLSKGGRLGMFGISGATSGGIGSKLSLLKLVLGMPFFHPLQLMPGNRGVFGVQMHEMYHETEKFNAWMNEVLRGVGDGWINPHVDTTFPFSQAGAAHAHIEKRRNIGKVLLVP